MNYNYIWNKIDEINKSLLELKEEIKGSEKAILNDPYYYKDIPAICIAPNMYQCPFKRSNTAKDNACMLPSYIGPCAYKKYKDEITVSCHKNEE